MQSASRSLTVIKEEIALIPIWLNGQIVQSGRNSAAIANQSLNDVGEWASFIVGRTGHLPYVAVEDQ
jgi:hypothetical protein